MDTGDGIRLREDDDGWLAVEEESGLTGRGESAREALAVLEARLESRDAGTDAGPTAASTDPRAATDRPGDGGPGPVDVDGLNVTISPKVELLFGGVAAGVGALYLATGNPSGAILIAVGAMLLVRVAWIEYGLFGR